MEKKAPKAVQPSVLQAGLLDVPSKGGFKHFVESPLDGMMCTGEWRNQGGPLRRAQLAVG